MSGNCSKNAIINTIEYCRQFSNLLETHRDRVLDILMDIEPYVSAEDEIERSISCLLNIKAQAYYIGEVKIDCGSSYLPLNQPLYAFVLNVFLLKLVSRKVYYRPPEKHRELHKKLFQIFSCLLNDIEICCVSRNDFFVKYVQHSDIVIFTGKYENAKILLSDLSHKILMIYNGSALNPIIVTPSANVFQSVIGAVNARLYNSGQDCMAPAGILVHESVMSSFMEELTRELRTIRIGENRDPKVTIGPMISDSCAKENRELLEKFKSFIVYGGEEKSKNLFEPTIFHLEGIDEESQIITYAPFFFLYEYRTIQDIEKYFSTPQARLYKGYVSIFGSASEANAVLKLDFDLIILRNITLFDYEEGNLEFGGYGEGCSFVSYNNVISARPILLLREINTWFLRDN